MDCRRCKKSAPEGAKYCPYCGAALERPARRGKTRGNGSGSVYRLPNGSWMATVTLGYEVDAENKLHRRTRSRCCRTKGEAVMALPELRAAPVRRDLTLRQLIDQWLPTHDAGKATLQCYRAALRYFEPCAWTRLSALTIDDLQECVDECGHGRRTQENMRTALGLAYKFGIPRHLIPEDLNLAQFLRVGGEAAAKRDSFSELQIARLRAAGREDCDTVLCMIYLGFRPSEFLALTADSYDAEHECFIGGAKTEAGTDRIVTVSPKILPIIQRRVAEGGFICHDENGRKWPLKAFTERVFYPALHAAGIENPITAAAGGLPRHKFTPHSCRHTFATLMKRAAGSDKDKLALIGHANDAQLRDYQDVAYEDLRRITNAI